MNAEFITALEQIEKEKGISKDILLEAIEAALISAYKRNFGSSMNVSVVVDRVTGVVKVFAKKTVVENIEDSLSEISIEEAQKISSQYDVGDIVDVEVTPKTFGRIAAQTAKQVVVQRIREAERVIIFEEFANKENDIVTGIIQRVEKNNIMVELGKTEAMLLSSEQVPNEKFKPGDRVKFYITEVKKTTKGPQINISRTHPGLVKRLFESEVPEIHDGVVQIKSISREPGSRTKIAVYSVNDNIDPVGACVGQKGNRVQVIVDELRGEKIDIIKWSDDPAEYIATSLSPAKVIGVKINEDEKHATVAVPDYQLSLAIGKEGQNVRLAAKLTGWKIDIKSENDSINNEDNNKTEDIDNEDIEK